MAKTPRSIECSAPLAQRPHHWVVVVAVISAMVSSHVAARTYTTQDIEGWTVAASTDGKGCFVSREYDRTGQTTLLLGLNTDGTNRLSILNANWSIRPKDRLELTFRLSNGSFPKHFAVGVASSGKQGFVTSFGEKFPAHFATSRSLDVFRGNVPVEKLNLDGSGASVAELRKCVAVQRSRPSTDKVDPAPSNAIPIDPFAPRPEQKQRR